jgi:CRP-like cAMP-binding protein
MRISQTRPFDAEATLCTVGRRPEALYLVVAGEVRVVRDGRAFRVGAGNFIGEVSFLLGGPATATVLALPGARCVLWPRPELERLMSRSPSLSNALNALLNKDLARKLSSSLPTAAEAS